MSEPVHTLRDVIDRARAKQETASNSRLMRIAREAGYSVSHTTLSAIMKGDYPSKPNRATMEALVYLTGLSFEDVQRAAGVQPGVPYVPPEGAQYLTVKQREVVNGVIRALAEANEAAAELSSDSESGFARSNDLRTPDDDDVDEYPNEAVHLGVNGVSQPAKRKKQAKM